MAQSEKRQLFDITAGIIAGGRAFVGGFGGHSLILLFVRFAQIECGQTSAFAAQHGFGPGQRLDRLFVFRGFYCRQSGPKMGQALVMLIIRPDYPRPASEDSYAQQAADDDDGARMLAQAGPLFTKPTDQPRGWVRRRGKYLLTTAGHVVEVRA